MAYALVGTIGAVSQGAAGAAVTPAWGTSESRTANNLLVCWVSVNASATIAGTPSGWSAAVTKAGTSTSVAIFYKIATGADTAPTIAAITSGVIAARLGEFSGNLTSSLLNQTGSAAATSSPLVSTAGGVDARIGELIVTTNTAYYAAAATKTLTDSINNTTAIATTNAGTSTASHYDFAYGVSTANASADSDSWTVTTTRITGAAGAIASFNLLAAPIVSTQACTSISYATATANGNITDNGGATITEKGVCYMTGTSGDPTTANSKFYDNTNSTGAYAKSMTGLSPSTNYRVRAYAINSYGTGYGLTVQLTTDALPPPTIVLNTPTDTATTSDTTPTLAFTGTSSDASDLEYRVQIMNNDSPFAMVDLSQGALQWQYIAVDQSTHDVYACVYAGDIYKQAASTGNFIALSQTTRNWRSVAIDSSNHNVYACVDGGDIYMQTAGSGNFAALSQTSRSWKGIAVDSSNHNVYACVNAGDIYMQTAGSGNFIALGQTARGWDSIAVDSSNHNVYATDFSATLPCDIYKQTAGTGNFVALGQAILSWATIAVDSLTHDVYACNSCISKQTAGVGNFVNISKTPGDWYGIAIDESNKSFYSCANAGGIYKYTRPIILDKISTTDTGFADITNGGDTHPFASGDQISYTVQSADILAVGTYYWRVSSSGYWSATKSFTVQFNTPTVVLNTPTDAGTTYDNTPTLTLTGTSSSAFDLEYNVQINTSNQFVINDFAIVDSNIRSWFGPAVDSSNHNVYVTVTNGDIYKQTGGTGSFIALSQTSRVWYGIAIDSSNQNVYAVVGAGDIYMQTAGAGNFIALVQTARAWRGIAIDSSTHDVYATVDAGDIYKQTGGSGNFVALSQTARGWRGITIDSSTHDVYAVENLINGDIYKQTGGSGNFVALGPKATNFWYGIAVDSSNHDIYVTTYYGDIFKQTAGIGGFVALNQTSHPWYPIAVDSSNHNVYVVVNFCYVLKYTPTILIDRTSINNTGFADITNSGDTHPFASGDQIGYTVQAGDILADGIYYWRAAAIDPSGNNFYGSWTTVRSLTVGYTSPTVALNTPTDTTTTSDTTPTLAFTGTSADALDLEYNIQIDTINSFSSQFLTAANFTKTLATGENYARSITSDTTYIYVGTYTVPAKVVRINKSDFTTTVTKTLATGENYALAITSDTNYVYVGTYTVPAKVVRINKSDFTTTVTKTLATGENNANAITDDTNYVYVGVWTAPAKVIRINKSDFTTTVTKTLATGEDSASAITDDTNYVYVGTRTIPAKVVRINKSDFTTTVTKTLATGEDYASSITSDTNYVYVGTDTAPAKVVRINKSDFTTTVTKTLASGEDNAYAITNDTDYVYVGTGTAPALVVRINKSDFTTTVTRTLATGENATYAITNDTNYVYVGTNTIPAKVVRINIGGLLISKFSATDTGFVDVTNGADTHPFASGDEISYTVQPADILAPGTYYWRAAAIDPSGSNTYGGWATTYSFTIQSPTVALNTPTDTTTTSDTTPTLAFTGTSADALDLEYDIQIDTINSFSSQVLTASQFLTAANFTKTMVTGENQTYAITDDTTYIYVCTWTAPAKVVRINKSDFTTTVTKTLATGENYAPAITSDTTYIYVGTYTVPAKVVRINKSDFTTTVTKTLATGEDNAAAITSDTNYVYVGTNTVPAKVVRINKSDFTTTVTKTLATGEDYARSITSDTTYIYVGTGTAPALVVRINKSDFTTTVTKTLATGEDNARSITSDTTYIYVGTYTAPAKVVRINKSDFTTTVTKTLATGEDNAAAITSDTNYVYVGTWTAPAKVVRINIGGPLISKFSATDTGFVDVTNGADTHPFASGDEISYTVQPADILAPGTYYWRAAAIDPSGTNVYGDWAAPYSFTVDIPPPTVALNTPTDTAMISDVTPTLAFTGTSPSALDLEYNIQVDTSNIFTGGFLSGSTTTKTLATGENNAYAITSDTNYVYVGTYTVPAKVIRINKSDFTTTVTKTLATGENNAVVITNDADYVYVGTNIAPAKVVRINKSDFTTTVTKTLATGEDYAYAITSDTNYVYVGTYTTPAQVVRINKSDFTTTVTKTLANGEDSVAAITNDTNYVYVSTYTVPVMVVRINKSDFTTTVTKTLATGENNAVAITNDTNYVYVGTYTTPAKVVRISLGSLFSKFSATDTGFADITNGGDTHPFASGDEISYTVQPADILAPGTYYWRAAAIDPSGSNTYGAYSSTRSFSLLYFTILANGQYKADLSAIAIGGAAGTAGYTTAIYQEQLLAASDPTLSVITKVENKQIGTSFTNTATTTGTSMYIKSNDLPTTRRGAVLTYDNLNTRYISCGGYDGTNPRYNNLWALTYYGDNIHPRWRKLSPSGTPPVGKNLGAAVQLNKNSKSWFVYFGGSDGSGTQTMNIADCTTPGSETWTSVTQTNAPAVRSYITQHMVEVSTGTNTYDVYLFGGWGASLRMNDLMKCSFDLSNTVPTSITWTTVKADGDAGSPSKRSGTVMIYDSANSRLVLFGGYDASTYLADLWSFDIATTTWSQLSPSGTIPAGRELHNGAYDVTDQRMVIFAGWQGSVTTDRNDIVSIGLTSGSESYSTIRANDLTNRGFAPYSSGAACFDSDKRLIVEFGQNGYDGTSKYVYAFNMNESLTSDANMYSINIADDFMARDASTYCVDSMRDRGIVAFGYSNMPDNTTVALGDHVNEIWSYDYSSNALRYVNAGVLGCTNREGVMSCYDSVNDRIIVFGGLSLANSVNNETWELKPDAFGNYKARRMLPSGNLPDSRWCGVMAFDSTRNRAVVWGGKGANSAMISNTSLYILDLSSGDGTWSQASPTGTPPTTVWQPMFAYKASNHRLYIYSGATNSGSTTFSTTTDYVDLTNATPAWVNLSATNTVAVRGGVMVLDVTNDYLVAFGGATSNTTEINTLSFLNLASDSNNWFTVSAGGTVPSARRSTSGWFLNGKFYVTGGRPTSGTWFSDVQELTPNYSIPSSSSWSLKSPSVFQPINTATTGLTNNTNYHWQSWATIGGLDTSYSSFGGNAESATDFTIGTVSGGSSGIKVWNGGSWGYKPVKVWSGSAWEVKPVKVWDGASWVTKG